MSVIGYEVARISGGKTLAAALPGIAILALGGFIVWELWKVKKNVKRLDKKSVNTSEKLKTELNSVITENNESSKKIKTELNELIAENNKLSEKIDHLQTKIYTLQTTKATTSPQNSTFDSLINESARATKNASKLAMLKQIVEDNVTLRQAT